MRKVPHLRCLLVLCCSRCPKVRHYTRRRVVKSRGVSLLMTEEGFILLAVAWDRHGMKRGKGRVEYVFFRKGIRRRKVHSTRKENGGFRKEVAFTRSKRFWGNPAGGRCIPGLLRRRPRPQVGKDKGFIQCRVKGDGCLIKVMNVFVCSEIGAREGSQGGLFVCFASLDVPLVDICFRLFRPSLILDITRLYGSKPQGPFRDATMR